MSIDGSTVVKTLRLMEWERAKGSLKAMLNTYWNEKGDDDFEKVSDKVKKFIKDLNDNHLG